MRRALHTLASSEIMGAVMDGAAAAAKMKLTFGQKAASLAPQAVYDVAHGIASTEVDPATLDHVSKGFPSEYNLLPPPPPRVLAPDVAAGSLLSDPESRAALVVVLHRLLQGGAKVRRDVPVFISEALNLDVKVELQSSNQPLLDLARIVYQLGELDGDDSGDRIALLRRLKGRLLELDVKEFGIAKEELDVLQVSAQDSTSLGIAAISAHLASYLSVIADFVAGLSCEALRAKTSVFDDKVYRQDSTHSSVADAAKVMKSLLLKSMLVNARKGSLDAEFIASIPEVHGAFKESLKVVSGVLRVEINRVGVGVDKLSSWPTSFSSSSLPQINYLLVDSFLSLMASLSRLVLYSSKRILESLKLISGLNGSSAETIPTWVEHFLGELQSLKEKEADIFGSFRNKLEVFRKAFILVQEARDVMALEGAVALVLLSLREADSAGKGLKGPRDMTLGKGTARGREILIELLGMKRDGETDVLRTWFEQLRIFFAPKDDTLQKFIDVVKALIESNEERRLPQVPKGTRDFGPEQMMVREKAFGIISKIFKQHGAVALDTPVFELRETLMGKYGEDSKLIYDLQDQGGQLLSLRYDLTVPFARYLAVNNLNSMKRYHIAKVYRRDNPSHGRYREFYQCDFDIAGQSQAMVYDAEVIKVLTELLDALDIGDYEVKLNHRRLLDGMLAICGVPESKFRSICSAIDKLDKVPWEKVRNEMVSEKGLPPEVADKIGVHVARKGIPLKVLGELKQQQEYVEHAGSVKALEELTTLFDFLQRANCLGRVVFDLSLARGLDYYTGVIFEAVFRGSTQVGSIAAGGRYDNLVGMFSGKQVPAVGVSLGIERVLLIMEQLEKVIRSNETQVLVLFLGNKMMGKAFELASELWAASLNAEFDAISPSKLKNKLESAAKSGIPYMVIVGEDEESRGIVKLKKMAERVEVEVPRRDLIAELINGL